MWTRIKLAGYSLAISWTLNILGEWVGRLTWGSGDKSSGLSLYTAPVYLLTYIIFVMPLVGCCRAAWQLRFWYVLLLVSLAWASLACNLVFHASLKDFLQSPYFLIWFTECALSSVTIYLLLLLLRSAIRRVQGTAHSNLIT